MQNQRSSLKLGRLYHEIKQSPDPVAAGSGRKGTTMAQKKRKAQTDKVLAYLKTHKELTRADGFEKLHILNLPEVIRKLRAKGVVINTYEYQKDGVRWCSYSLR